MKTFKIFALVSMLAGLFGSSFALVCLYQSTSELKLPKLDGQIVHPSSWLPPHAFPPSPRYPLNAEQAAAVERGEWLDPPPLPRLNLDYCFVELPPPPRPRWRWKLSSLAAESKWLCPRVRASVYRYRHPPQKMYGARPRDLVIATLLANQFDAHQKGHDFLDPATGMVPLAFGDVGDLTGTCVLFLLAALLFFTKIGREVGRAVVCVALVVVPL